MGNHYISQDEALESDAGLRELMDRIGEIRTDLAAVNKLRRDLQQTQKWLIRHAWRHCGYTLREAARIFGVPKTTLQRWATIGEWDV